MAELAKAKKAFYGYILIEVFPMNAEPTADQLPVVAVFRRSIDQPRIPFQWDTDHSAIGERNAERFVIARNVNGKRLYVY